MRAVAGVGLVPVEETYCIRLGTVSWAGFIVTIFTWAGLAGIGALATVGVTGSPAAPAPVVHAEPDLADALPDELADVAGCRARRRPA